MIRKIIQEVIEKYKGEMINESLTPIVYHFCDLSALWGICVQNKFILTSSNTNQSDRRMSKKGEYVYPYYMCFSRTKSPDIGYTLQRVTSTQSWKSCLVRIEIDGSKLNNLYKSQPVNYFIDNDDDKIHPYTKGLNPTVDYKQIARQQMYEYEDRLLCKKPFIGDANQYIKRIDILTRPDVLQNKLYGRIVSSISHIVQNNTSVDGSKIFLFTDKNAFKRMDDSKAIPSEKFISLMRQEKLPSMQLSMSLLQPVAALINLICFAETQNIKIKRLLIQKYGFGDYAKEILELCGTENAKITPDNLSQQVSFITRYKPNFKKNGFWKYAVLMDEMINDYMRSVNIPFKGIPMYKKTQWNIIHHLPLNKKQKEYENICRDNLENSSFISVFLPMSNNNVKEL